MSVRFAAAAALGELGDPRAVELLIEALKDKDLRVRFEAALALGVSEDPRAVGPLIEAALKDEEGLVRAAAAWALRRMDPEGKVFKFI
ncbi:MAG: HEAT repeat domain-containing protein [Methanobacteriales archaeon]|nr:HEAT repeat domain-containing protein [Methanobacteriales archaeon]